MSGNRLSKVLAQTGMFEPLEVHDDESMCSIIGRLTGDPSQWGDVVKTALFMEQNQPPTDAFSLDVGKTYFLMEGRLRWAWRVMLSGTPGAMNRFLSEMEERVQAVRGPVEVDAMPLAGRHKEGGNDGGGAYPVGKAPLLGDR